MWHVWMQRAVLAAVIMNFLLIANVLVALVWTHTFQGYPAEALMGAALADLGGTMTLLLVGPAR